MNKEQTLKAAAVMTAWASGKEIEYLGLNKTDWLPLYDKEHIAWQWQDIQYRVKPLRYRVAQLKDTSGKLYAQVYNNKTLPDIEAQAWFSKWLTDWTEHS